MNVKDFFEIPHKGGETVIFANKERIDLFHDIVKEKKEKYLKYGNYGAFDVSNTILDLKSIHADGKTCHFIDIEFLKELLKLHEETIKQSG